MNRLLLALVVLAVSPAPAARAADVEGRLRVTGRLLWDGNAPRDYIPRGETQDTADGLLSLLASAEGRYTAERWQLVGRYDGGGRAYFTYTQENTLVQAAALEASHALGDVLGVGGEARAKDRRGGSRAYTDLAASAFAEYAPDAQLALRLRLGAHRFLYRPDFSASFAAPEGGVLARYRLDRHHAFALSGEYGARRYPFAAQSASGEPSPSSARRQDVTLLASLSYTYKGPVSLGLAYTYLENSSNSYGQSLSRHRLSATLGMRLPWQWTLLAQGALGFNAYPDGVYLSPEIILLDEDETQNMLSARLVRPVSARLDVELSAAVYGSSRQPSTDAYYFRAVAGVGLTLRPDRALSRP